MMEWADFLPPSPERTYAFKLLSSEKDERVSFAWILQLKVAGAHSDLHCGVIN